MTTPDVTVVEDSATLAAEVASRLLARLEELQAEGREPHVALTGGSIADQVHREIARRATEARVDWSRVVIWWGDERFVGAGSPERNALQARRAMLEVLLVPSHHVHEVPSSDDVADVAAAAASYALTLHQHGADGFDVLMLGIGPDGHVASLFPGHDTLQVRSDLTVAVSDSPKPPPQRVSLTFEALNRSDSVWFIASGESKAEAVAAGLAGGPVASCPARGVQGRSETLWLLDEAAASAR